MKALSILMLILLSVPLFAARELPAYLPSAPTVNKIAANYTVADVMGLVCTAQEKLPADHPYAGNKSKKDLKTEWPGATVATNIDQFLNYLLLTPSDQDEKTIRGNIYWILHEVMNVSEADKSAAILRVYAAQTDVAKKRKIALFAEHTFTYLMDVNLLALVRDLLDDNLVLRTSKSEDLPPRVITLRGKVRLICRNHIVRKSTLNMTIPVADHNHIYKNATSEEQSCQRMKQWMIDNWALITTKAATAKAKQDRVYARASLRVFNPRP